MKILLVLLHSFKLCLKVFYSPGVELFALCPLSYSPNAVLRLRFTHFATECSWDHMYVYDGDSIYSPLIAVFR